jgi:hypothetical protein
MIQSSSRSDCDIAMMWHLGTSATLHVRTEIYVDYGHEIVRIEMVRIEMVLTKAALDDDLILL